MAAKRPENEREQIRFLANLQHAELVSYMGEAQGRDLELCLLAIGLACRRTHSRTAFVSILTPLSVQIGRALSSPPQFWNDTSCKTSAVETASRVLQQYPVDSKLLMSYTTRPVVELLKSLAEGEGPPGSFSDALLRSCTGYLNSLAMADWNQFSALCMSIAVPVVTAAIKEPKLHSLGDSLSPLLELVAIALIPFCGKLTERRKALLTGEGCDDVDVNDVSRTSSTRETSVNAGTTPAIPLPRPGAISSLAKLTLNEMASASTVREASALAPLLVVLCAFSGEHLISNEENEHVAVCGWAVGALGAAIRRMEFKNLTEIEKATHGVVALTGCIESCRPQELGAHFVSTMSTASSIFSRVSTFLRTAAPKPKAGGRKQRRNGPEAASMTLGDEAKSAALDCARALVRRSGDVLLSTEGVPSAHLIALVQDIVPRMRASVLLVDAAAVVKDDPVALSIVIRSLVQHIVQELATAAPVENNGGGVSALEALPMVVDALGSAQALTSSVEVLGGSLALAASSQWQKRRRDLVYLIDCFRAIGIIAAADQSGSAQPTVMTYASACGGRKWIMELLNLLCTAIKWEWSGTGVPREFDRGMNEEDEDILCMVAFEAQCALEAVLRSNLLSALSPPAQFQAWQTLLTLGSIFGDRAANGALFEEDLPLLCKGAEVLVAITEYTLKRGGVTEMVSAVLRNTMLVLKRWSTEQNIDDAANHVLKEIFAKALGDMLKAGVSFK